jgi:hypothetical protein
VLNRRARVLVPGLLLAVAALSLTGCRTSPSVAAYVGDAQVTTAELESAVEQRLADPLVAAFAEADEDAFTRRVLGLLVQEEVYAEAAERYGVEVTDAEVGRRIEVLLGGDDPDAVFDQLAEQQGIGREDVVENVRQQLIRQEIAIGEGAATEPTAEDLRARYEEVRESQAQLRFGYITVPDQATADSVLAQLQADPGSYPAVAATYPGQLTLPALQERSPEELQGALAEQLAGLAPGTGFTVVVEEVGGVIVGFLDDVVYPPFDELRPQLEQEALDEVSQAGAQLVEEVRGDLDITVNPRFGQLDEDGQLVPTEGGVVDILDDQVG